jgi:peroxiredoxin
MEMKPKLMHSVPAPDFSLYDLNGELHALKDYLGHIVVINFWSAECPWSARADEQINEILQDISNSVVLLSIASNVNEKLDKISSEASNRSLPLVLLDENNRVADLYGAITTPHIFVIDAKGVLQYQGALDDVTFRNRTPTQHYFSEAVKALLRGDTPNPVEIASYGCTIVRNHV